MVSQRYYQLYRFPTIFIYLLLIGCVILLINLSSFTIFTFNLSTILPINSWDSDVDLRIHMFPQLLVTYWNRNGSPDKFCVWYNFTKSTQIPDPSSISLCTHGSIGYSKFIFDHAQHWSSLISVSLLLDDKGFRALRAFQKLHRCIPEAAKRVSGHLVWRAASEASCSPSFVVKGLSNLVQDSEPSNCNLDDHIAEFEHSLSTPYPPNSLRNIARKGAATNLHLIADIENHFSFNASQILVQSTANVSSETKVAVIVRRFEYNDTLPEPLTVDELHQLMNEHQAFEFHHFIYARGHRVPGLNQWFNYSMTPNSAPTLQSVGYYGSTWEPQLVVHSSYPYHFEGFPIRIHDQQALPYELCRANYSFAVASHAFSFHKGIKFAPTKQETSARRAATSLASKTSQNFKNYLNSKYSNLTKVMCNNW